MQMNHPLTSYLNHLTLRSSNQLKSDSALDRHPMRPGNLSARVAVPDSRKQKRHLSVSATSSVSVRPPKPQLRRPR
ncbi:hypothetical protein PC116_g34258 [Phytophthora cactorum]|nr:hypothetical protein PC116_g34258 [Phytophthora cactorum]